ncbi:hypothetical protein Acr_02g0008660 [Actinidia rufa]|uniref:Uncharacterized protein n=1 Tax=Actinidia rufa TaxID=165716 RepID=A0A7J0E8Y7_9ERIC|nr:hypothetical protein Acr_02g0008660 [Actinidia rufa]
MIGDLKAEPPLWHEDSRRKPCENRRDLLLEFFFQARHPGTISGQQLGEAAHRLVVNSLQVRENSNGYSNQMHGPPRSYATTHEPPLSSYQNNRHHGHERNSTEAATTDYPAETAQGHHPLITSHNRTKSTWCYGHPYTSPTVQNSSSRSCHQHVHGYYPPIGPILDLKGTTNVLPKTVSVPFMDTTRQGSNEMVEIGILHMVLVMFKLPLPFQQEPVSINMVDATATETTDPMVLLAIII